MLKYIQHDSENLKYTPDCMPGQDFCTFRYLHQKEFMGTGKEGKFVEWFLRIALSIGLLSAVADRFGLWPKEISAWGNWKAFTDYTGTLLHFLRASVIPFFAALATALEIIFGIVLLIPFKTRFFAQATGALLLCFGLAMAFSLNIKAPLDYSVFIGAAAAFALAYIVKRNGTINQRPY